MKKASVLHLAMHPEFVEIIATGIAVSYHHQKFIVCRPRLARREVMLNL